MSRQTSEEIRINYAKRIMLEMINENRKENIIQITDLRPLAKKDYHRQQIWGEETLKDGTKPMLISGWKLSDQMVKRLDAKIREPLFKKAVQSRGIFKETILHSCVIFMFLDIPAYHALSRYLIEHQRWLIDLIYENKLYYGEVALHVCAVKGEIELFKCLIESGATCSGNAVPRAQGSFFLPQPQSRFRPSSNSSGRLHPQLRMSREIAEQLESDDYFIYYGEFPLNFAACEGYYEMIDLCLDNGAEINRQDICGNTVLHLLVITDVKYGHGHCKDVFPYMIKYGADFSFRNNKGQTALSIAAREGDSRIFDAVMDACKYQVWNNGPVSLLRYDLGLIDTGHLQLKKKATVWVWWDDQQEHYVNYSKTDCVLLEQAFKQYRGFVELEDRSDDEGSAYRVHLATDHRKLARALDNMEGLFEQNIVTKKINKVMRVKQYQQQDHHYGMVHTALGQAVSNQRKEILQHPILKRLVADKWNAFGRRRNMLNMAVTILHLFFLTVAIHSRPSTPEENYPISDFEQDKWNRWLRLGSDLAVVCTVLEMLVEKSIELSQEGLTRVLFSGYEIMQNWVLITHLLSVLGAFGLRFTNHSGFEAMFTSIAAVSCWLYFIFILRAWKMTGSLIVMLETIIKEDIARFIVLWAVVKMAFGYAFLLYNTAEPCQQKVHLMDLFMADFNHFVWKLDALNGSSAWYDISLESPLKIILYLGNGFLSVVVLLNLVIAMMGYSFALIWEEAYKQWWLQRAELSLTYEAMEVKQWRRYMAKEDQYMPNRILAEVRDNSHDILYADAKTMKSACCGSRREGEVIPTSYYLAVYEPTDAKTAMLAAATNYRKVHKRHEEEDKTDMPCVFDGGPHDENVDET